MMKVIIEVEQKTATTILKYLTDRYSRDYPNSKTIDKLILIAALTEVREEAAEQIEFMKIASQTFDDEGEANDG
jgi:hypothetical protein